MLMQYQNEKENLSELLLSVNRLINDTLNHRSELQIVEEELDQLYVEGKLTELKFQLELQSVRRAHKDVNYCIKSLEQQKKLALWKLRELS